MPGYFDPLPRGNDAARGWSEDQLRIWHRGEGRARDVAWGVLGWDVRTTDVTGISALADVTGLAVTVTVGANRYIRIYGSFQVQQLTSAGIVQAWVREGSTTLGKIGVHTLQTNERDWVTGAVIQTPTAGEHTYKLSLQTSAGTVDAEMTTGGEHGQILVEDIGPVS